MKHFLIDTNILIDLVADRKPFSKYAVQIFNKAEKEEVKLYASALSLANMHYILLKFKKDFELRRILNDLSDYLEIIPLTKEIIKQAFKSVGKDFEDQIQLFAALSDSRISAIITRNIRDFRGSSLQVLAPDEALASL